MILWKSVVQSYARHACTSAVYPAEANSTYHSWRKSRDTVRPGVRPITEGVRAVRTSTTPGISVSKVAHRDRCEYNSDLFLAAVRLMLRFGPPDATINALRLETLDFRTSRSDTLRWEVGRSIFVDKSSSRDVTWFKLHQLSGLRVRACTGFNIFFFSPCSFIFLSLCAVSYISNTRYSHSCAAFLISSLEARRLALHFGKLRETNHRDTKGDRSGRKLSDVVVVNYCWKAGSAIF